MQTSVDPSWRPVSKSDFEDFLKVCDDYTRDAFSEGEYYQFRFGHRFALHPKGKEIVFVRPDLLKEAA